MGVKFARVMGEEVGVFTTSPSKKEDALRHGAREVVISRDLQEMAKHTEIFDFIVDAVSAEHDVNPYIMLLKKSGNLMMLGAATKLLQVSPAALIFGGRSISGTLIRRYC